MSLNTTCIMCNATDGCQCYTCGEPVCNAREGILIKVRAYPMWGLAGVSKEDYYNYIIAHLRGLLRRDPNVRFTIPVNPVEGYQYTHNVLVCRNCSDIDDDTEVLISLERETAVTIIKSVRGDYFTLPVKYYILKSFYTLVLGTDRFDVPIKDIDYETLYEIGRDIGFQEEPFKAAKS